jgi:hypothetical protein
MVVAAQAIDRFLSRLPVRIPAFKGMDRQRLELSIYNSTGQPFKPKTELQQHQLEGIAFALYQRRALLYFEPRMRKTSIALNWAEHLRKSKLWLNKGLVIAHSPDGLPVWEREAALRSDLRVKICHLDLDEFIDGLEDNETDLIVVPWSGLQEMFGKRGINRYGNAKVYAQRDVVADAGSFLGLCIIDEIHLCMNHLSLRFNIAAAMTAECKFRLGLTGTPFGRNPFALWSQAFLVDRGETLGYNYYFFEQAFGTGRKNWFSGKQEYKFDKKKMPQLERKMSSLAMIYKRSEVEQQTVLSTVVELHMWGDQLDAYRDVVDKLVKLDRHSVEIQNTFHRLRQVASGYLPFKDRTGVERIVHFRSNPKLEWLEEFAQHAPADVQVVIFHHYIHTGKLITDMLRRRGIAFGWLYGGSKDSRQIISDFQDRRTHILVANATKGGMSIDMSTADYLIFYESPVSPIQRQQAQDRPMARGARSVTVDDLVCSGVERRILHYLAEGQDLLAALSSAKARKLLA